MMDGRNPSPSDDEGAALADCELQIRDLLLRERTPEVTRQLQEATERWSQLIALRYAPAATHRRSAQP